MSKVPLKTSEHEHAKLRATVFFLLIPAVLFAGCSAKQAYYGMQEHARSQCVKISTQHDYAECLQRANMSYEEYELKRAKEQSN